MRPCALPTRATGCWSTDSSACWWRCYSRRWPTAAWMTPAAVSRPAATRLGVPLGAAQQRAASDLTDTSAIPGALAVDDANTSFLTDEYVRRQNGAALGQAAVVVAALAVLAVLAFGQRFMARTYGR